MDYKLYTYPNETKRYKQAISHELRHKENLEYITLNNAFILPVINNNTLWGNGGILDSNHQFIESSGSYSRGGLFSWGEKSTIEKEIYVGNGYSIANQEYNYLNEDIVYLGFIHNHWGHFIIDHSVKLWYISKCDVNQKYAFIIRKDEKIQLHDNIWRFFELLGLAREQILFINKITKVKKVTIPDSSYISNDFYTNEYIQIFDKVIENAKKTYKTYDKIFFSRKRFSKANQTEIGEFELSELFENNNYKVIYPEELALDEQIYLIRNAKEIVAISGSLTHNMIFANNHQKIIILNNTYIINLMQIDINYIRELNVTYIDSYISFLPVKLGSGPFILDYNQYMHNYAKDVKLKEIKTTELLKKESKHNIVKYLKLYRNLKKTQTIQYNINSSSAHYFPGPQCQNWQKIYIYILKIMIKIDKIRDQVKKTYWSIYWKILKWIKRES